MGVKRDIGNGVLPADEELVLAQMGVHDAQGLVTPLPLLVELVAMAFELIAEMPEAHDGDIRLMAVLLEEQPLQHLRPLPGVGGQVAAALGQMKQDRVGFRETAPVGPFHHGNTVIRILRQELGRARAPRHDVDVHALESYRELRQQQPDLVGVAGFPEIVKPQLA